MSFAPSRTKPRIPGAKPAPTASADAPSVPVKPAGSLHPAPRVAAPSAKPAVARAVVPPAAPRSPPRPDAVDPPVAAHASRDALSDLPLPELQQVFLTSVATAATWQLALAQLETSFASAEGEAAAQLHALGCCVEAADKVLQGLRAKAAAEAGRRLLQVALSAQGDACQGAYSALIEARSCGVNTANALTSILGWLPAPGLVGSEGGVEGAMQRAQAALEGMQEAVAPSVAALKRDVLPEVLDLEESVRGLEEGVRGSVVCAQEALELLSEHVGLHAEEQCLLAAAVSAPPPP